jgi:GSH-dependent disulfide-bond oxidoreductase
LTLPQAEGQLEAWLWATPNSNRVSILFEELGLNYRVHGVNIRRREQFAPEVLTLNPYGKIPIVRWREAGSEEGRERVLFESGAILIDFAERHGRFLPPSGPGRAETLAWLMVVLTGLGPMTGQAHHWTELAPEKPEAAIRHTVGLVERIYRVMEGRLGETRFLAGGDYSIADIAAFPWIARSGWANVSLDAFDHVRRWRDEVALRPGVARGMAIPAGAKLE